MLLHRITEAGTLLWRSNQFSRRQVGLIALSTIALPYLFLLAMVEPVAAVSATPRSGLVAQESTPTLESPDDPDSLGPAFLAEYDRLLGQPSASPAAQNSLQTPDGGAVLPGTFLLSLLLVVALAYAGIWGFKQYVNRQSGGTIQWGGRLLSLQESHSIGHHQKLHLVRLGGEVLLIGATDQTITCLARYAADQIDKSFSDHLQAASTLPTSARPALDTQAVPLQESLHELRKVQRWPGRSNHG